MHILLDFFCIADQSKNDFTLILCSLMFYVLTAKGVYSYHDLVMRTTKKKNHYWRF